MLTGMWYTWMSELCWWCKVDHLVQGSKKVEVGVVVVEGSTCSSSFHGLQACNFGFLLPILQIVPGLSPAVLPVSLSLTPAFEASPPVPPTFDVAAAPCHPIH